MLINSSNNIIRLFGNSLSNKRCNYCHEKKNLIYSCYCQEKLFCSMNCYNKYKISSSHKCNEKFPSKKSFSSKKDLKKNQSKIKNWHYFSLTNKSLKCLVGIKNLGNSCYINSAIQCLNNIYEFSNYFLINEFDYNRYEILYRFSRIIKKLHYGN